MGRPSSLASPTPRQHSPLAAKPSGCRSFCCAPIWPGTVIRVIGILPLLLGVALSAWAGATFRRHVTALMPWTRATALVTDGPYGFSRNPIYLSFVLMYLGLSFIFDSAYVLIMLALA
jgi:protein-S-isoprenylcysteine O-methyltransferase Ste14